MDHLRQSRLVLIVSVTVLAPLVLWRTFQAAPGEVFLYASASILLALLVRISRTAPWSSAWAGSLCAYGLMLAHTPGGLLAHDYMHRLYHSALPCLIVLFLLTAIATRTGRDRKVGLGLSEPKAGRAPAQVMANLAVAAIAVALPWPWSGIAAIAALAESTADTLASEIGEVYGGPARLITTLRRVPTGTNGGITFTGSLAALLGASAIAGCAVYTMRLPVSLTCLAAACGLAGCFLDSFLGATIEREDRLGNDAVNLLSTLFAALLSLAAASLCLHFAAIR